MLKRTCDGHSVILKAIAKVYPNEVIQLCLVHISAGAELLSRKPRLELAKELRIVPQKATIFDQIT